MVTALSVPVSREEICAVFCSLLEKSAFLKRTAYESSISHVTEQFAVSALLL